MLKGKVILLFFISVLSVGCNQKNSDEKLLKDYFKEEHDINVAQEDYEFLVFFEKGCTSCNNQFWNYIVNNTSNKRYLVYVSAYPMEEKITVLKECFGKRFLLDRSNNLKEINIGLKGSGKIIFNDGELTCVKTFDPTQYNTPQN